MVNRQKIGSCLQVLYCLEQASCRASHRSSNSKVLTTRIFFSGVLVGLYGADSSLPSLPNIWIAPWFAERITPTRAPESEANCWAVSLAFFVASARSLGLSSLNAVMT